MGVWGVWAELGPKLRRAVHHGALRGVSICGMVAMIGCGGGGGSGSSGAGLPAPTASATALAIAPGVDGETNLTFNLVDPTGLEQMIDVEYSDDRGATYQPATLTDGHVGSFTAGAGGGSFDIDWVHSTDLANANEADLMLRVTPREAVSGREGTRAISSIFGVGTNSAPTISSLTTPTGTQGGIVEIDCVVTDGESDHVGIEIEYSLDNGGSWFDGTTASTSPISFATSPGGTSATVHWDAQGDAPDVISSLVLVRLTPVDMTAGTSATSGTFSIFTIAPDVDSVTIGDIPNNMNGSETYTASNGAQVAYRLRVPASDTSIRIEMSPGSGGAAVDENTLVVTCDRAIGSYAAGDDLSPLFLGDEWDQIWTVTGSPALPTGLLTLTATIEDIYGNISESFSYTVEAHAGSGTNRPFDWNDTWYLDFTMDQFTISGSGTGSITITSSLGANGTPDHLEDLVIAGLQAENPTPDCITLGSNAILQTLVEEQVLGRLRELFGGDFDGTIDGFAPNLKFERTSAGTTSAIRIGGDDSTPGFALGRAHFDHRNGAANFNRAPNLGVFSTNLMEFYVNSFHFRQKFGALMPGVGTPAGEDAYDAIALDPSFDRLDPGNHALANLRYDQIWEAIDAWGRAIAVVTAHEVGHSIGLCSNGAPPDGLFGGVSSASFSGPYTTSFHFDSTGNNLMAAALSFSTAMITSVSGYHFNELNEAYLREWHLLGL